MFQGHGAHAWHMVLMVGVVAIAMWLGAGAGGALLLSLLACIAMMAALIWIAVRSTRIGAVAAARREPRSGRRGAFPDRSSI